MIQNFKSKGLELFFTTGNKKGIQPQHAKKLDRILRSLADAAQANEMDIPGWVFHPLKHWGENIYAVRVDGNYRVTFRFVDGHAYDVNYEDYH